MLEVLGAPYSGPDGGRDLQGEFFSEKTDFMMDIGDKRPVLYYHGDTPEGQVDPSPEVIGVAEAVRRDERGMWFEVTLDKAKGLAERIWEAAMQGIAAASTGSIGHLVRRAMSGELLTWPIAELTLLDVGEGRMPANPFATVSIAKAFSDAGLTVPEAFAEAEEAGDAEQSRSINEAVAIATALYAAMEKENE